MRRFCKSLLILLVFVMLGSCSQVDLMEPQEPDRVKPVTNEITIFEAQIELNKLLNDLYGGSTKSFGDDCRK